MPAKKKNKREDKRRRACFLLRQQQEEEAGGESGRQALSAEAARELFQHITANNVAKFGVVKLHGFQLDAEHPVEELSLGEDAALSGVKSLTLMSFANLKCRDKIMAALLRCGADPRRYPGAICDSSTETLQSLNTFPPSYAVWLIRKLYEMAKSSRSGGVLVNPVDGSEETYCPACEEICEECSNGNLKKKKCETINPHSNPYLRWDCGHLLCWNCSWRAACRPLVCSGHAMRCPLAGCRQRCDGGSDDLYLNLPSSSSDINQSQRKEESYLKWKVLPESLAISKASPNGKSCHVKPVLKAQPYYISTTQYLGTIQPQRIQELHKASASGDLYRLHALLDAGVDIEGVNEYGQTAFFIACMHSQVTSVKYLLWAGACVDIVDNSKCNIFQVIMLNSTSKNRKKMLQMLDESTIGIRNLNEIFSGQEEKRFDIINMDSLHVTTLIPWEMKHPGAGACYIDDCFTENFLSQLDELFRNCPVSVPEKPSCSQRSYLCDSDGSIRHAFASLLDRISVTCGGQSHFSKVPDVSRLFPFMRFLCYNTQGGLLPPHEDLSRSDYNVFPPVTSTHTFILYLSTCNEGGETNLLFDIKGENVGNNVLASVKPVRGRLLLFPHRCPHEGSQVISLPKLLLRGEAF